MSTSVSADAPEPAEVHRPSAAARAEAQVEEILAHLRRGIVLVLHVLASLSFIAYLFLAVINFWLFIFILVFGSLRVLLRGVMLLLLFLSGGLPPRAHGPASSIRGAVERDLKRLWAQRLVAYEEVSRPVARHYLRTERALRTWWHWHFRRKVVALAFAAAFVLVPALYVVPRSHYVQITDKNAIHYGSKTGGDVVYLVHGLDLFQPAVHREYLNEDAWWLGKINSQGLKSQMQVGKNYRLSVVGIRWYYAPQLFPNIISATEVDDKGVPLTRPTSRIGVPTVDAR